MEAAFCKQNFFSQRARKHHRQKCQVYAQMVRPSTLSSSLASHKAPNQAYEDNIQSSMLTHTASPSFLFESISMVAHSVSYPQISKTDMGVSKAQLLNWRIGQLKSELHNAGLHVFGVKANLQSRLLAHFQHYGLLKEEVPIISKYQHQDFSVVSNQTKEGQSAASKEDIIPKVIKDMKITETINELGEDVSVLDWKGSSTRQEKTDDNQMLGRKVDGEDDTLVKELVKELVNNKYDEVKELENLFEQMRKMETISGGQEAEVQWQDLQEVFGQDLEVQFVIDQQLEVCGVFDLQKDVTPEALNEDTVASFEDIVAKPSDKIEARVFGQEAERSVTGKENGSVIELSQNTVEVDIVKLVKTPVEEFVNDSYDEGKELENWLEEERKMEFNIGGQEKEVQLCEMQNSLDQDLHTVLEPEDPPKALQQDPLHLAQCLLEGLKISVWNPDTRLETLQLFTTKDYFSATSFCFQCDREYPKPWKECPCFTLISARAAPQLPGQHRAELQRVAGRPADSQQAGAADVQGGAPALCHPRLTEIPPPQQAVPRHPLLLPAPVHLLPVKALSGAGRGGAGQVPHHAPPPGRHPAPGQSSLKPESLPAGLATSIKKTSTEPTVCKQSKNSTFNTQRLQVLSKEEFVQLPVDQCLNGVKGKKIVDNKEQRAIDMRNFLLQHGAPQSNQRVSEAVVRSKVPKRSASPDFVRTSNTLSNSLPRSRSTQGVREEDNGRAGNKKRAGEEGFGGGEKKKVIRRCGLCSQPGHNRTRCPMKEGISSDKFC